MYLYLSISTYIIVQSHDCITTRILVSILSINTYIIVSILKYKYSYKHTII